MTNTFAQLRTLFEACVDLPEGERVSWLDRHVSDTAQRLELELMLLADRHDDGFLQHDVVSHIGRLGELDNAEFDPGLLIGKRYGAFELVRLLGRGGQGAVYLGRRVDADFEQTAAVKLLRRGLHDAVEHRRFRREREILARFEHPGVARLIDGGVSAEGVPYLVMEHVDGEPIDRWCESRSLDPRARLELVSELCGVVAAAHRNLIVHRDLKPSNVLVTTGGAVKVLDFGIARLLDEEETNTELQLRMITPGYGAPEQASGGAITLATDVHALGVMLRVLLTGEPPEGTPVRVAASPTRALAQDLRWIIGKASAADAELRYRDAAELNEDIRRYLDGRPVLAHPPSRWYQVRRFARRHRGGIVVTTAFVIGILASLGIAVWQARVAREQLHRAEATRDFLLDVFEAAEDDLPRDARPTPDNLVRAAADRLEADPSLDALSRADFIAALATISNSSNDHEQALRYADRAIGLLDSLGQTDSRPHLALETVRASALLRLGRAEEADRKLTPRLQAIRSTIDATAMEGLSVVSLARIATGHIDDGIGHMREAIGIADSLGGDPRDALSMRMGYAYALWSAGRIPEAAQVVDDTLQRWNAAGAPQDHHYATLVGYQGSLKARTGHLDEAIAATREALRLMQAIYDPGHELIADQMQNLAVLLGNRGDYDEAARLFADSTPMYAARFGPSHPQSIWAGNSQANFELQRGHPEAALEPLKRNVSLCEEHHLEQEKACMNSFRALAEAYLRLDRTDEASVAAERSLAMREAAYGSNHPDYANALLPRADVQLRRGDAAAALGTVETMLGTLLAAGQDQTLLTASALRLKAAALHLSRRDDEALVAIDAAAGIAERLAARDALRRLELLTLRADVLSALGRSTDARRDALAALTLARDAGALKPETRARLEALAR